MYFQFACDHCGKNLKAREEHRGKRVVCPYCKGHASVPKAPSPELDDFDPLQSIPTDPAAQSTHESAKPKGAGAIQEKSTSVGSATNDQWVDGTNVSLLKSCFMGIGATIVFFVIVTPLYFIGNYFGKLFIKLDLTCWVPVATTFLLFWALGILLLKSRKLKRQRQSMLFDLLPNDIGHEINEENLGKFIKHVHDLPGDARESFVVNRVKRGLEHFGVRKSASEVATIMASQSEIDANAVESSYSIMNVFIWAIPILGFIGTVIGIGSSVGEMSGALGGAGDLDKLKEALGGVTQGLGSAFDTTLVALVMSMFVMFPMSSIKKAEDDLLNWVDEYCNENLLKRLNDGLEGSGTSGGISSIDVRKSINAAMAEHHAVLEEWSTKLESSLGNWNNKLDANSNVWTKKLEAVGKALAKQVAAHLQEVNKQLATSYKEVNQHEQSLFEEKMGQLKGLDAMTSSMRGAAEALGTYCENLNAGLTSLNQVLHQLGEQQVVIQQIPSGGFQHTDSVAEAEIPEAEPDEEFEDEPEYEEAIPDGAPVIQDEPIIRESANSKSQRKGWFFSRSS